MKRNFLKLCLLVILMAGAASLAACNTAEGFGKDLSSAGDSIQGVFN